MTVGQRDLSPLERQSRVLAMLKRHGRVSAAELAESFAVSEDSIRRDLREMAAAGLCRRIYGGALLPTPEFPRLPARVVDVDAWRMPLARCAASLIRPGDTVLLDAGSTNVVLAGLLAASSLTVVTNAPSVAQALAMSQSVEVVMIGGRVDPRVGGSIGAQAMEQIASIQADVCIPGICALDLDSGAWGMNGEEAAFKRAMIASSDRCIVIATNDKVGARGNHLIAGYDDLDHVVVTKQLTAEIAARLAEHVANIHCVSAQD